MTERGLGQGIDQTKAVKPIEALSPTLRILNRDGMRGLLPSHLLDFKRILGAYGIEGIVGSKRSQRFERYYVSPGLGIPTAARIKITSVERNEGSIISIRKWGANDRKGRIPIARVQTNQGTFHVDRSLTAREMNEAIKQIDLQQQAYAKVMPNP